MAEAMPSTSAPPSDADDERNIQMLLDKLKELRMGANSSANANLYGKIEGVLKKEVDRIHMSEYIGVVCDSDDEMVEDDSDDDYFSDDEATRKAVDYGINEMFQTIKHRDFDKWSLSHIHNRYRQIHEGESGRKQLSRIRGYVKRGSISSRSEYKRLQNDVWDEVYSLGKVYSSGANTNA